MRLPLIDRVLVSVGLLSYALGAWGRIRYALVDHPPRHFVISDASNMLLGASRMLAGEQNRWDTVWPPGEMAFTALLSRFDATLTLAGIVQVGLSLLVPWMIADVSRQLTTRRGFWFGLAAGSLHIGFIHHVGFFLSEGLFQVATATAIWLSTLAIRSTTVATPSAGKTWALSLSAGLSWGLAALFRPNALPVLLASSAALFVLGLRARERAWGMVALGTIIGALLVIAPAAQRCTSLKGGFCPVSSNFAMNIALGQAGERVGLSFEAADGSDSSSWFPPALADHGYVGQDRVPAGIFDTRGVLLWVWQRIENDPGGALRNAIRNGTDLFRFASWPRFYGRWPAELFELGAWAFAALVLIPGALGAMRAIRQSIRDPRAEPAALFAVCGVASVVLLAALSMGEGRYRYPFDAWFIALAARAFWTPQGEDISRRRLRVWLSSTAAFLTLVSTIALTLTFLPATSLATKIAPDGEIEAPSHVDFEAIALSQPLEPGTPWNRGTVILPCAGACTEMRVHFAEPQRGRTLNITSDHNDAYRVSFYAQGRPQGFVDLPMHRFGTGLFRHFVLIPAEGRNFDELRISPLYGDGRYSIGHVLLR